MKKDIHPQYFANAKVTCACGNTWETGATQEELRTDVCSECHPFYTGKMQRIIDSAGQVERFNKRVETARALRAEAEQRNKERVERARARNLVEIVDEDEAVEPIEGLDQSADE